MGLLYSNYECKPITNNTLKINACSGGIYKTYKESWFKRFHLKSETAEKLFKPYGNEEKISKDTIEQYSWGGSYTKEHKEPVIILQMVICGDMEVIAELITEKDFNKYFEEEKGGLNENGN